jgi:hypothetical protein
MGRHSKPEQGPFYRSVLGWIVPWVLIAAVVGGAVWFAVGVVGGDEVKPTSANDQDESPSPDPEPEPTETKVVVASPEPSDEPEPEPEETKAPKEELITDGITIQVLNGTSDAAADDAMAERLRSLGFDVVAVEASSVSYPNTTVFWSYPEAQEAAERLAARSGWKVEQNTNNLSDTVAIHVVVGGDEAG